MIRIMADIRSVPFSWESFYLLLFVICYLLLSADEISYIPHFSWESFSSSIICYYSISFEIICSDFLLDICYLLLSADEITHTPLSVGIAFVCYYLLFFICYLLLVIYHLLLFVVISGLDQSYPPFSWESAERVAAVLGRPPFMYKCKHKHKHKY